MSCQLFVPNNYYKLAKYTLRDSSIWAYWDGLLLRWPALLLLHIIFAWTWYIFNVAYRRSLSHRTICLFSQFSSIQLGVWYFFIFLLFLFSVVAALSSYLFRYRNDSKYIQRGNMTLVIRCHLLNKNYELCYDLWWSIMKINWM